MHTRRLRSRFSMHASSQPPSQPSLQCRGCRSPHRLLWRAGFYAARPENRSVQPFDRAPGRAIHTRRSLMELPVAGGGLFLRPVERLLVDIERERDAIERVALRASLRFGAEGDEAGALRIE